MTQASGYPQHCCRECGRPFPADEPPTFVVATGEVAYRGRTCRLSPTEVDLFALLHEAHPVPVKVSSLLADLYPGDNDEKNRNTLMVFVTRIRQKLRKAEMSVSIVSRGGCGRGADGEGGGYSLLWGNGVQP